MKEMCEVRIQYHVLILKVSNSIVHLVLKLNNVLCHGYIITSKSANAGFFL